MNQPSLFVRLFTAFATCMICTTTVAAGTKADNVFGRSSRELTLSSKEGRKYRVVVSVPDAAAPKDGYPVIYVLDGNAWFGPAVDIVRMREYEKLSPTIVVGIAPNNRAFFDVARSYDFTPKGSADPDFEGIELGGAQAFASFLGDNVQSWMRAHYRIDEHRRILFGHSLGGLFVLHALFSAPQMFDVYLAASPDVVFADREILKQAQSLESNPQRSRVRLLVTDGSLEAHASPALIEDYRRWYTAHPEAIPGMTVDEAIRELFRDDATFDKIAETRAMVEQLAKSGMPATFVEFDGEEHMSAAISALNRGIPFALRP